MPGIHVRSLGKLDWVERGNEPVLTVPGAYWLCHKKHIYKFTFKWHKTLRNTEGFAYPKELTKVIRRIIKSQPRQGQQFGTRNLLVTYNHSAWMRQDKMFAMLKFQDRSEATAFPHAFVLTVKTLDAAGESQKCDPSLTLLEDAKNARLQSPQRENPQTINENNQKMPELRSNMEIFTKVTYSEADNDRSKKETLKKFSKRSRSVEKIDDSPTKKRSRQYIQNNSDEPSTTDFADLPYQYIIEKEIEESKSVPEDCNPGPSNRDTNNGGKSVPRSPRTGETARSADITDLVMEGLMFTIRQDQDSVTVVEQKTKLEMDEVLENSEKAETAEGEKCLLNSSLLRLESLITKIEMSEARINKSNEENKIKSSFGDNTSNLFAPDANKHLEETFVDDFDDKGNEIGENNEDNHDDFDEEEEDEVGLELKYEDEENFSEDFQQKNSQQEILIDDIEENKIDKHDFSSTPIKDCLETMKFKTPRIVSDEIVTEDQIPLELQKALRDKRSRRLFSNDNDTKRVENPDRIISDSNKQPENVSEKDKAPEIITEEEKALEIISDEVKASKIVSEEEKVPAIEDFGTKETRNVKTVKETDTIDLTKEFKRELSRVKSRRHTTRRKSLRNIVEQSSTETSNEKDIHIEMWKFIQDITRGAKVVVHRLDLANIPNGIVNGSSLEKYNSSRRFTTES